MKLYIKGDFTKEIPFDYLELAKRMWFENYQGEGIPLSYSGFLRIKYRFFSQIDEELNLDYEDAYVTDFRENGDCLRLASTHLELLTLDKRAFYIMAIEIATIFNGQISEDDKKKWLTVEEFKEKHQDILSLTFDEANEISLEEIQTIDAIDDPIWEELDRKREEYIKIHGERVYDDEEDE